MFPSPNDIKPDLSMYLIISSLIESIVLLSDISAKTPNEVCQLAYNNIKSKIEESLLRMQQQKSSKVGYQFIPE